MTPEADKSTMEPVRPLLLIDAPMQLTPPASAIQAGRDAGCDVLAAVDAKNPGFSALWHREGVDCFEPAGRPGRGATVSAAADVARQMGKTHLITLDPYTICGPGELARVVARSRAHPDAIVSAVRRAVSVDAVAPVGRWRAVANFLFRVQTGLRIKDSTSGLRSYPVDIIERLTPWARGAAFDYEVLVRGAWAGACIREMETGAMPAKATRDRSFVRRAVDGALFGLLNVHLTMRSITPWPHRKIVPKEDREGGEVSILHPWRSLKILVGQNISARRLGLAGALGVFLGTLPLIGCHSIAILFAAGFFRLSKVAALGASQLCMPPLVPALCIEAGYFIRHGAFLTEISLRTLGHEALERVLEWFIGSLVLAPLLAVLAGMVIYLMAGTIEKRIGSDADSSRSVTKGQS